MSFPAMGVGAIDRESSTPNPKPLTPNHLSSAIEELIVNVPEFPIGGFIKHLFRAQNQDHLTE